jgi:hypothetical protein
MRGVDPRLVAIASRALAYSTVDFGVIEGLRSTERQKELVLTKASKTMNSRHLTGHAIDVMAYIGADGRWEEPLYHPINDAFQQAAKELGIAITWGGSWGWDFGHFELD